MQYNREFHKLSRFAPRQIADEKDKVQRFFSGLRPLIQRDLSAWEFATHAELLDKALKVEEGHNQYDQYRNQGEKKRPHPANQSYGKKPEEKNQKRQWNHNRKQQTKNGRKCADCGKDHETKECRRNNGACFNCGEKGHLSFNCPKGARIPYNKNGQNQRQLPAPPQRTQGRVFALTNEEASNAHDVVKGSGRAPM